MTGAVAYQIQLYFSLQEAETDSPFQGLVASGTNRITVQNPQRTFYWRVKTRNDYAWGNLSDIRSFTTPTTRTQATIDPVTGGTLNTSPGYLIVNFPPGAVTQPTDLEFNLLANPRERLPNFRFANRAFTLEAFVGTQRITQFNKPFMMLISYDPSDLLAAGIADPQELNPVFWNGSTWQNILPCAGCSIDTENQKVTIVLDHLSEFALVAPGAQSDVGRIFLPAIVR